MLVCSVPLAASARSRWSASNPAPRSTKTKQCHGAASSLSSGSGSTDPPPPCCACTISIIARNWGGIASMRGPDLAFSSTSAIVPSGVAKVVSAEASSTPAPPTPSFCASAGAAATENRLAARTIDKLDFVADVPLIDSMPLFPYCSCEGLWTWPSATPRLLN